MIASALETLFEGIAFFCWMTMLYALFYVFM
jgi:hypothetical protein